MKLYMKVTNDKYELPLAVADSPIELADLVGCTAGSIYTAISHRNKGYKNANFVRVEIEDDEMTRLWKAEGILYKENKRGKK